MLEKNIGNPLKIITLNIVSNGMLSLLNIKMNQKSQRKRCWVSNELTPKQKESQKALEDFHKSIRLNIFINTKINKFVLWLFGYRSPIRIGFYIIRIYNFSVRKKYAKYQEQMKNIYKKYEGK